MEVKLGSKTGLDTVQNEKHVEVEVDPPEDSNQAPLVRVTPLPPSIALKLPKTLTRCKIKACYCYIMLGTKLSHNG